MAKLLAFFHWSTQGGYTIVGFFPHIHIHLRILHCIIIFMKTICMHFLHTKIFSQRKKWITVLYDSRQMHGKIIFHVPILLAADVSKKDAPSEYANSSPFSVVTSLLSSKSDLLPITLKAEWNIQRKWISSKDKMHNNHWKKKTRELGREKLSHK